MVKGAFIDHYEGYTCYSCEQYILQKVLNGSIVGIIHAYKSWIIQPVGLYNSLNN